MRASNIISITRLKCEAAELVRDISEKRLTVMVTQNGEPKVVVVGVEAWEELQETMAMLKLLTQSDIELDRGEGLMSTEAFARAREAIRSVNG
jgi:prevent-host-death family protein